MSGYDNTNTTREFSLGAVLSVTTGRLLCPLSELYDILGFMVDESLFTHQLPRVSRECEGPLLEQHPALRAVRVPDFDDEPAVHAWIAEQEAKYGAVLDVAPLTPENHTRIDPITELRMLRPDAAIIGVVVDDD